MRELTYNEAALEAIAEEMRRDPKIFYMSTDALPPLLKEFGAQRIRATPIVLAGLLAVLGVGVLAHLLVTSIRKRRRDLAVIKTLGATRRQLASAVAWQATTLVAVALVVGVPLGTVKSWIRRGLLKLRACLEA